MRSLLRPLLLFVMLAIVLVAGASVLFKLSVKTTVLIILASLFRWVLIPAILLSLLGLAWYIVRLPARLPTQQIAKAWGFGLGCAIFALVIILNLFSNMFVPNRPIDAFHQPWWYIGSGLLIGGGLMALINSFLPSRTIALLVVLIVSTSLSALYFYLFIEQLRDPIVLYAICILISTIAYVVINPEIIDKLRRASRR